MTEEFLHYVWQYRLYGTGLTIDTGETLEVLHPGYHNTDSGPDFFNAKLQIGETIWAGNIEIHVNSSEWYNHRHHLDKNYDNIILHVVWLNDQPVSRENGEIIPVLELSGRIDENAWNKYLYFMASRAWIPCENMLSDVDDYVKSAWLERLLVERLERKSALVEDILKRAGNDYNETFYRLLARNMGFKLNNEAFGLLADNLPYSFLLKHADDLFQLEAMIFGQAGLLQGSFKEEYPVQLQREYAFLRSKYSLKPVDGKIWRFARLHPGNFPTIRLAQFAAIIHKSSGLFSRVVEAGSLNTYLDLFSAKASGYWQNHYLFDKQASPRKKSLGEESIRLLIINLVAPLLFVYGRSKGSSRLTEKPVELLNSVDGETNSIIKKWNQLGMNVNSAAQTQALIELKTQYCNGKKCLSCSIGNVLLRAKKSK
ncbi:MAG TPA: DUF2851 family protein [Bacteroidales bacterium]|jgi:hypothetical protein|nr:DUF2851 family protein [Bacteroidales bacterium]